MAIEKHGSPERITQLAKDSQEFEKIREGISKENSLVRCPTCEHLIAKRSSEGYVDIQHKKEAMLIKGAQELSVKCPVCGNVISIL